MLVIQTAHQKMPHLCTVSTILCIETSGPVCSVAISTNGKTVAQAEVTEAFQHAAVLLPNIDDLLRTAEIERSSLDAIAVSAGPGSYTGLRIGVSTAKGLCYSLDKPLIGLSTLKVLAHKIADEVDFDEGDFLCPMIDARRNEVFLSVYDASFNILKDAQPVILDADTALTESEGNIWVGGNGAPKATEILKSNRIKDCGVRSTAASDMAAIAHDCYNEQNFVDTAYFEPLYTKAFYSGK